MREATRPLQGQIHCTRLHELHWVLHHLGLHLVLLAIVKLLPVALRSRLHTIGGDHTAALWWTLQGAILALRLALALDARPFCMDQWHRSHWSLEGLGQWGHLLWGSNSMRQGLRHRVRDRCSC